MVIGDPLCAICAICSPPLLVQFCVGGNKPNYGVGNCLSRQMLRQNSPEDLHRIAKTEPLPISGPFSTSAPAITLPNVIQNPKGFKRTRRKR